MSKEFFGRSHIEDLGRHVSNQQVWFRTSECGSEITLNIWVEVFPTSKYGSPHLLVQNAPTQIFNITSSEKNSLYIYDIDHKNLNSNNIFIFITKILLYKYILIILIKK